MRLCFWIISITAVARAVAECSGSNDESYIAGYTSVRPVSLSDPVSKCPDEWFVEPLDFALDPKMSGHTPHQIGIELWNLGRINN